MNIDIIEIVRWVNLTLATIALIGWIYFKIKFREPASIAPLTWLINVTCYYTFRLVSLGFDSSIKNTYFLNLWSGLLHTHAIILLGVGVFMAFYKIQKNETCMRSMKEKIEAESRGIKNDQ